MAGCGHTPQEPQTDKPRVYASARELPNLFDDTRESPLGQYDETTVFANLLETNKDGMVLEMQNKIFLFYWTEKAQRHYEGLGIVPGNEVGVQFEISEGKLIANDVELVSNQ